MRSLLFYVNVVCAEQTEWPGLSPVVLILTVRQLLFENPAKFAEAFLKGSSFIGRDKTQIQWIKSDAYGDCCTSES